MNSNEANKSIIAVLIPTLKFGGAERIVVDLTNHWVNLGMVVDVVVFTQDGEFIEQLDSRINLISFEISRMRHLFFPLRKYLNKRKPAVLWVHLYPLTVMALLSTRFLSWRQKIYVTHHNMLMKPNRGRLGLRKVIPKIVLTLFYRFATGITCVSQGVARELTVLAPRTQPSVNVIYNPYSIKGGNKNPASMTFSLGGGALKVLNVGELKPQKNQLLLVEAVVKARQRIPIECCIIGSGPLFEVLKRRIKELKAESFISLVPFQKDLLVWYQSADVFVLTSNWEGFGNVLVEALSVGLRIISTNCPSGPAEILKDGEFGVLIPPNDIQKLVDALISMSRSNNVSEKGRIRAKDFEINKISDQYLCLFFGSELDKIEQ